MQPRRVDQHVRRRTRDRLSPEQKGADRLANKISSALLNHADVREHVDLGFVDSYWYWRIRAETAILDPENLPKKSSDPSHACSWLAS